MPFPKPGGGRPMRGVTVNKAPQCHRCGCRCGVLYNDPNNIKVCADCLKNKPCVDGCCAERPSGRR